MKTVGRNSHARRLHRHVRDFKARTRVSCCSNALSNVREVRHCMYLQTFDRRCVGVVVCSCPVRSTRVFH